MIAITGGGTGGHLAIAKAIKEELNSCGIKPVFIGSSRGQDKEWFEDDEGFCSKYFFDTQGVVNKSFFGKISSLGTILKYTLECKHIFAHEKIEKVFSVGGYSAAAASFASILLCKDLFIHEQNAHIGRLNSLLMPMAKDVFSSYLESSSLKNYPVNEIFFKNARERKKIKKIIFLGGSQGASFINDFALEIAKELSNKGIKIIHQSGKNDYEKVKEFYDKNGIKADIFDFTKDLSAKLKDADFAVSRAGASTLWELAASCIPTLFVPYPYASGNHQFLNAKHLVDKKLAFLKTQDELKKEDIFGILDMDLSSMSSGLKETIEPNGAKKIVNRILD